MRGAAGLLAVALLVATPAHAHKLKVFATKDGQAVSGYAFFVGGGRPEGSAWTARDAQGRLLAEGTTDPEGRFAFVLPGGAGPVTVTVDAHDAHVASTTLATATIGAAVPAPPPGPAAPGDDRLAALVEAAVARQVAPLLERIEEMDARLRYVDMLSGIFLIGGLAGLLMWARGRRA